MLLIAAVRMRTGILQTLANLCAPAILQVVEKMLSSKFKCLIQKNTQQKIGKNRIFIDVCQDLPHWWFQPAD